MSGLNRGQQSFLDLLLRRKALLFGDFTLKSGRKSPYFVNAGRLCEGSDLKEVGRCYAELIHATVGDGVDVVFGPAYKGIPLACATAMELESVVGHAVGWCFDRKEVKDHGDGGGFVGAALKSGVRVVLVDDVLTAGTALRQGLAKLAPTGVSILGAFISVDRQEKGKGDLLAREEIATESGVPVHAILTVSEVVDHLEGRSLTREQAGAIRQHLSAASGR